MLNVNPLTPESYQHQISPHNISHESHIKVTRIKELITKSRSSWLLGKFFLEILPLEMCREQYGEYAY